MGLAITIVVLRLLVPRIWEGLESTILQFLELSQVLMAHAETVLNGGLRML